MTPEELAALAARTTADARWAAVRLPWRTRVHHRAVRLVDRLCYRLVKAGRWKLAVAVWRALGMW